MVCAADNDVFKARLLSSTLFMNGFTTVAMNLFGVRYVQSQNCIKGSHKETQIETGYLSLQTHLHCTVVHSRDPKGMSTIELQWLEQHWDHKN